MRHRIVASLCFALGCSADDGYGIVQLQLQGPSEVFGQTNRIVASLDYLECLTQFYEENPDETQEGGSEVFDEWKGKLCDGDIKSPVDCEVASIEQGGTNKLTIAFEVSGDVSGRRLALGPLPDEQTAGCAGDTRAEIRIAATSAVVGMVDSTTIWHAETFSANQAIVGQGAPITIDVAAN